MKKKSPVKKTRNRKPGMKSTDGMPIPPKAYVAGRSGERLKVSDENVKYKILGQRGVDRLFKTPESLWEAACNYFEWVLANPWYKNEYRDGAIVQIPVGRPMTIVGLCLHMGTYSEYFRNFRNRLNEQDAIKFASVIKAIEDTIYRQKFEGAGIGAFNATIISRDLGLRDHMDVTSGGEKLKAPAVNVYNTAPPMADSEDKIDGKK